MYRVGSGDIKFVLAKNRETKTYKEFMMKFLEITEVHYNALASPIDACRIGAILEKRFFEILSDDWYDQYKTTSTEMDVLTTSLDFAKLESGKVVDFIELKTVYFTAFMDIEPTQAYLKKKYKGYYEQIQSQLYASNLQSCLVTYLVVYSYDDAENYARVIEENQYTQVRIFRDEECINRIKNELVFYQNCKNHMMGRLPHVFKTPKPVEVDVPF